MCGPCFDCVSFFHLFQDLDLPPEIAKEVSTSSTVFTAPNTGLSASQKWMQKCSLAAEHAAAGQFDMAMQLLNRQLGICCFEPLLSSMMDLHRATHASLPGMCGLPPMLAALDRSWNADNAVSPPVAPVILTSFSDLEDELKKGYKLVTAGEFSIVRKLVSALVEHLFGCERW